MPYLELKDGNELYFNDWGTGTPVVLIHGWPLSSAMWEKQASFLAENGYRVIAYDRRGFGRSSQPWDGYNYDRMSDDLAELLNALDLQNAALVGFSMGGGEVVRYLSRHGAARIGMAVLVSSIAPYMLKTDSNPDGTPAETFDDFRQKLAEDRFAFLESFAPGFYGSSVLHHTISKPALEWTFEMASVASPKATIDCVTAFSSTDLREEMKTLSTPFLVIHGTGDKTVAIDAAGRAAAKILPNVQYLEYEDEPHGLFWTAADRLNKDLLDFLGGDHKTVPKLQQI